jgi:hypothetical protein
MPALKALGNIIKANDIQVKEILGSPDFLPRIFELISHSEMKVRKRTCWLLKNLTSNNICQTALILDNSNYMEGLRKVLTQDAEEVAIEVARTLNNLVSHASSKQILEMIKEYNYLELLSFMLDMTNPKIQEGALKAASKVVDAMDEASNQKLYIKMLRKEGLSEKISPLTGSSNRKLSKLAKSLRGKFNKVCRLEKKDKKEENCKRDDIMWMEERRKV